MSTSAWEVAQGDCLDVMGRMREACVDAVVTDPPYSSGTRREAAKGVRKSMTRSHEDSSWFGSDSLTTNGLVFLVRACALQWHRLLKPGGHVLAFIDWRMYPAVAAAIESADLRHAGLLVWDKTYFGMGTGFRNQHELVVHFTKGVAGVQRKDVGNVLRAKPVRGGDHPTEKPVDLLQTLLTVVTPPGGIVLDPFTGSGTTGVAAVQEGFRFIGIEREAQYVEIARARIAAAVRS